jgi:hypothetical protein
MMIQREPARGNDTVNVGMEEQILSPGVEDRDDTTSAAASSETAIAALMPMR